MPSSASRRCTECGGPLPDGARPDAVTCSNACRQTRKRRKDRARARAGQAPPGGERPENEVYDAEQHELARAVAAAELAPYVREQISEDVITAIGGMLALTPKVVAVLEQDLVNPDPQIRMKAATLIARYSMGDRLIPGDVGADNRISVSLEGIAIPTGSAGPPQAADRDVVTVDATPIRECDVCGQGLPEEDFEAGAPRCRECQQQLKQAMLAKHGS